MTNEVNIVVTGEDLSGPAFDSAMARMLKLKALADALSNSMENIANPNINPEGATAALIALRQKMQALGIADIADVDVQPGKLVTQLNLLKRLITAAGIPDMLDVNISAGSIEAQLSKLHAVTETIPVDYAYKQIGAGPSPLAIEGPKTEQLGIDAATLASWAAINSDVTKLNAGLGDIGPLLVAGAVYWEKLKSGVLDAANALAFTSDLLGISGGLKAGIDAVDDATTGFRNNLLGLRVVADNVGDSAVFLANDALLGLKVGLGNAGDAVSYVANDSLLGLTMALDDVKTKATDFGSSMLFLANDALLGVKVAFSNAADTVKIFGDAFATVPARVAAMAAASNGLDNAAADAGRSLLQQAAATTNVADQSKFGYAAQIAMNVATLDSTNANYGLATALLQQAAASGVAADASRLARVAQIAMTGAAKDSTAAAIANTAVFTAGAGMWGGWTGKITLFGGAFNALNIGILSGISAWHALTEGIIEFAGTLIPATLGMVAFGVVAAPTAQHIYVQMSNLWTTTQALNESIPPITSKMMDLGNAVKPEVYTAFGEALVLVNAKAGIFAQTAAQVGKVVDSLGARFVAAQVYGTGFNTFMKNSASDFQGWGTLIGNIGGIIGNVLKVLPGYAQDILVALDNVTHALEVVTGSTIGQWVLGVGIAFHGAVIWLGLFTTAVVYVGNALLGLLAKIGLVDEGMTIFNATLFGAGLKTMLSGVVSLGGALVTFAGAEDIAAASSTILTGAFAMLEAATPLIFIAALVGIGLFIKGMVDAQSATQAFDNSMKSAISAAPINQFSGAVVTAMSSTVGALAGAKTHLDSLNNSQVTATGSASRFGLAQEQSGIAVTQAQDAVAGYSGELQTLQNYQNNYNLLVKEASGNTWALAAAGITSNDVMGAGVNTAKNMTVAMEQLVVQVQAQVAGVQAMSLGTGRAAAAMNALNYSGDTTNNMLGSLDVDMQKIVTGQDALTGVILGGEQAFLSFQDAITGASATLQTPAGLQGAASVAGASIGGLNAQSQALANSFYNDSIPAFQKLIDAEEMQLTSTQNLTAVVATGASQMLPFIGNNTEARSVIIAMINDALGPGTVSLQNLNTWVAKNSTSLQGFNNDVAQATINAGQLGNLLATDLNTQFQNALLTSSGASAQIKILASDIANTGANSDATRSARLALIQDLENAGYSAQQAAQYVTNLMNSIDALHGKLVTVQMNGQGQYTITGSVIAASQGAGGSGNAAGGLAWGGIVTGGTTPTADDVLIRASKGETVVSAAHSAVLAPAFAAVGVPGYAGGGILGFAAGGTVPPKETQQDLLNALASAEAHLAAVENTEWQAQLAATAARAHDIHVNREANAEGIAVGNTRDAINFIQKQKSTKNQQSQLAIAIASLRKEQAILNVYESELSAAKQARIIADQDLLQDQYIVQTAQGIVFMAAQQAGFAGGGIVGNLNSAYMSNMEDSFVNKMQNAFLAAMQSAMASAVASSSSGLGNVSVMDSGGWLRPGLTHVVNNTGRPEYVPPPGSGGVAQVALSVDSAGSTAFEAFMVTAIREWVRLKGGGNVQKAFGRP